MSAPYVNDDEVAKLCGAGSDLIDDVSEEHANTAKRESQADAIVKLAAGCTLTHTSDGVAFATMQVGSHRETRPVRRSAFKGWLKREYYLSTCRAPNAEAMTAALGVIEARAQFDGQRRDVHLRLAHLEDRLVAPAWGLSSQTSPIRRPF